MYLGVNVNKKLLFFVSLFVSNVVLSSDIFKAIELRDKKSIKRWIKNNHNLDIVNADGQTALIKASKVQDLHIVEKLLRNGAGVNQIDKFGKTALDYAVELGNRKIAFVLVDKKASVSSNENACKCEKLLKVHFFYRLFKKICLISLACLAAIYICIAPLTLIGGCVSGYNVYTCLGICSWQTVFIGSCALSICAYWLIAKIIDSAANWQYKKLNGISVINNFNKPIVVE